MPILFVWPSVPGAELFNLLPLGIGYLKANLPEHHAAFLWDGLLEKRSLSDLANTIATVRPEVVAFSVWAFNRTAVADAIALVRGTAPDVTIIAGGPAVSGLATAALDDLDIDFGIAGEGEWCLPLLLDAVAHGKRDNESLRGIPGLLWRNDANEPQANSPVWADLSTLNSCDYGFIQLERYLEQGYRYGYHPAAKRTAPVTTTRGCPFPCEYCSARDVNGKQVRTRLIPAILEEIRRLHAEFGIDGFNIIDDNFTLHMAWAKDLCRGLISLRMPGVSFNAPNGIKVEYLDDELLGLMKTAGWECLFVAPESGSVATLKRMQKPVKLPVVQEKIRLLQKYGFKSFGFFIIGYPGETPEDIAQTIRFACESALDMAVFTCFQPLAGTPVAKRLVESGEIDAAPVGVDYYKVTYAPKGMNTAQLKRLRFWGHLRFYTSSWSRFATALRAYSPSRILTFVRKLARG